MRHIVERTTCRDIEPKQLNVYNTETMSYRATKSGIAAEAQKKVRMSRLLYTYIKFCVVVVVDF